MFLADSHVVLWLANDDPKLGSSARAAIASEATFVSAVTVLELTIKAMKGRIVIPDGAESLVQQQGLRPLPLQPRHAVAIRQFPELDGRDPFDRALLAQAKADGLVLITADRRLLALGHDWIIDATT